MDFLALSILTAILFVYAGFVSYQADGLEMENWDLKDKLKLLDSSAYALFKEATAGWQKVFIVRDFSDTKNKWVIVDEIGTDRDKVIIATQRHAKNTGELCRVYEIALPPTLQFIAEFDGKKIQQEEQKQQLQTIIKDTTEKLEKLTKGDRV